MHKKQVREIAQLHGYMIHRTFLSRTRSWPAQRRREYILTRLRRTLVRAWEGTRYYREAFDAIGYDPRRDFSGPGDLRRLPILTKDIVRARFADLIDRRFLPGSVEAETSGTTGEPMRMRLNERYIAFDVATNFRYWAQAGYRFRDPFVALRSFVPKTAQDPLWRYDRLQNCLFMSAYHLTPGNAQEYVDQVLRFQPKFIRGYPSSLSVFAEYAYPMREKFERVRGLFTASETLTPGERATIERTFGRKLFDWYGMTEPVLIISEGVEHDGMEVNWEYGFGEFLPADEQAAGEFRLVATGFHNPVMPFIRYETGDLVRLDADAPADGAIPLDNYPPRVRSISGRKDECIITPSGRRLPSVNFYTVFRDRSEVLRFQIVQYGQADVLVKIALRQGVTDPAAVTAALRESLAVRIGEDVRIDFQLTDRFITNSDGKTQPIVRRSGSRAVEENRDYVISAQQAWLAGESVEPVLKLDWNEADTTPGRERIRAALQRGLDDPRFMNWYPAAGTGEIDTALARYTGVAREQIVVTHGSDAAIEAIAAAFVQRNDRVLIVQPTYDNFRATVEQRGAVAAVFEWHGSGAFPIDSLCERVTAATPRVLYLANPNNPIGYVLAPAELERIVRHCAVLSTLVVVDEAYFEFCGITVAPLVARYPNVLALRTFSKAFGLAGMRIGYVLAAPDLARLLQRVVNPKSVTMFATTAALAALEDPAPMQAYVEEVAASRARIRAFLEAHGIASYPSSANFVLFRIDRPAELLDHFAAVRIFFRDRSQYFSNGRHVRMTVGTRESTDRVIAAFEAFLRTRQAADRSGDAPVEGLRGSV